MTDTDLQRLVDIEAIKQLKARYFRFLDTKQWRQWGQVFTEDIVMEVPEAAMVNNGRAEVVGNVSAALTGTITTHHGHMPEIELTGADTARGTWAMFDYVEWPAGPDGARVGLQGYGHYHEEYRREVDGQWRIAETRLERLRVDPLS
jgi:hypothetical protein